MSRGASARRKGNQAERDVAKWLRAHGWSDARTTRDARGGTQGGADITGVPGWAIEVKHHARPDIAAWWRQTAAQAETTGDRPLLVWRLPGIANPGDWLAATNRLAPSAEAVCAFDTTPARHWPAYALIDTFVVDRPARDERSVCVSSLRLWAYHWNPA